MSTETEKHSLLRKISDGKMNLSANDELLIPELLSQKLIIDASSSMGQGYKLSMLGEDYLSKFVFPKSHRKIRKNKILTWVRNNSWKFLLWVLSPFVLALILYLANKIISYITKK